MSRPQVGGKQSQRQKARAPRNGKERPQKKTPILDHLDPGEAQTVLRRLLAAHSDLGAEAERIAGSLLGEVSFETIAWEVEDGIRAVDLDDLDSRAGRHSWGYTEPSEAAWELLQEAVDPFLEDMKRRMELGLEAEAAEICKGILLGLYGVRDAEADEIFGWAADFPEDTAADTAVTWCADGAPKGPVRRERAQLLQKFAEESTPEWVELIKRVLSRR